jgi:hypothetical protein
MPGRPFRHPFFGVSVPVDPRGKAAVKQLAMLMAEPSEHPPEPARNSAAYIIVDDDTRSGFDAPGPEGRGEPVGIRQRVAAFSRFPGPRQVLVEVSITGAWYMSLQIRVKAGMRLQQLEPAIDSDYVTGCPLNGSSELIGADQAAFQ